jgi:hypothetical protein
VTGTPLQIEPSLQYGTAAALYQEVLFLNTYLSNLDKDWGGMGRRAYVVSFHIVVSPEKRNMPYDTYIDLSITKNKKGDKKAGKPTTPEFLGIKVDGKAGAASDGDDATNYADGDEQVQVVPLLATDSIESLLGSSSDQNSVSMALGLAATISSLPVSADLSSLRQTLSQMVGKQWNSTLLVGRSGKNTVRIRLGAMLSVVGSKPAYVTVPMSHDISVIVLVPRDTQSLRVLTSRTFREAESGTAPRQMSRSEIVRETMRAYDESVGGPIKPSKANLVDHFGSFLYDKEPVIDRLVFEQYDDLLKDFLDGDFTDFASSTKDALTESHALQSDDPKGYADKIATQLWEVFADHRNLSPYTVSDVELGDNKPANLYPLFPKMGDDVTPELTPANTVSGRAPDGTLLVLNGGHLQAVVGGGRHFEAIRTLSATLTLTVADSQNRWQRMVLNADTCQPAAASAASGGASPEETLLNLAFPLPAAFDLFGSALRTKDLATIEIVADNRHIRYNDVPLADLSGLPGLGMIPPSLVRDSYFTVGDKGSSLTFQGGQRLDLMRMPAAILEVQPNLNANLSALGVDARKLADDIKPLAALKPEAISSAIKALASQATSVAAEVTALGGQAVTNDADTFVFEDGKRADLLESSAVNFGALAGDATSLDKPDLEEIAKNLADEARVLKKDSITLTAANIKVTSTAAAALVDEAKTLSDAADAMSKKDAPTLADASGLIGEINKLPDLVKTLAINAKTPDSKPAILHARSLIDEASKLSATATLWSSDVERETAVATQQAEKAGRIYARAPERGRILLAAQVVIEDSMVVFNDAKSGAAPAKLSADLQIFSRDATSLSSKAMAAEEKVSWWSSEVGDLSFRANGLAALWDKTRTDPKPSDEGPSLGEIAGYISSLAGAARATVIDFIRTHSSSWSTEANSLSDDAKVTAETLLDDQTQLKQAVSLLSGKEKDLANVYQMKLGGVLVYEQNDLTSRFESVAESEEALGSAYKAASDTVKAYGARAGVLATQAVGQTRQIIAVAEEVRAFSARGSTPTAGPMLYQSGAAALSPDYSQLTLTFPTLTTAAVKLIGVAVPGEAMGVLRFGYRFGGFDNLNLPATGRIVLMTAPPTSATKVLTLLADHVVAPRGSLAVSIATTADPVTIAIQGATFTQLIPIGVVSPPLALQLPIAVPAGTTGSYTLEFSDLSPDQLITFTVTDPLKKSDPNYQPEIDTVRVVDLRVR